MPTVYRTGSWRISIYADDHAPAHFHIQTPDGESLVDIDGLKVRESGANPKAQKAALVWARENIDLLVQVWHEQNQRT